MNINSIFAHRTLSSVTEQNNFWNELTSAESKAKPDNKTLQESRDGGIFYRHNGDIYLGKRGVDADGSPQILKAQNGIYSHEGVQFQKLDRFRWFQTDDGTSGLAVRMAATGGMVNASAMASDMVLKAFGSDASDQIKGGARGDSIQAGDGNDILEGMAGDDAIWGGDGDDVLDGGAGKDRLEGGAGRDTFMINSADGDEVVDFKRGEDKLIVDGKAIDFDKLPAGYTIAGNQLKKGDTVLLTFK